MRNNSFFDDMEYLYASIGMLSVPGALPDLRDLKVHQAPIAVMYFCYSRVCKKNRFLFFLHIILDFYSRGVVSLQRLKTLIQRRYNTLILSV